MEYLISVSNVTANKGTLFYEKNTHKQRHGADNDKSEIMYRRIGNSKAGEKTSFTARKHEAKENTMLKGVDEKRVLNENNR